MATVVEDFTGTNSEKIDKLTQAMIALQTLMRSYAIVGYICIPTLVPATFGLTAFLVNKTFDAREDITVVHTRLGVIDKRLDKMEDRLDKMEDRLEKMDIRIDQMDSNIDSRLDNIEQTLARINKRLDTMAPKPNKQ